MERRTAAHLQLKRHSSSTCRCRSLVMRGKWQQSDVPRLLDRARQTSLMCRTHPSQSTWNDLAALRHKSLQQPHVAIWNCVDLLRAELAHLLATEKLAAPTRTAGPSTWARSRARSPRTLSARARDGPRLCSCALRRPVRRFFSHAVSSITLSARAPSFVAEAQCYSGNIRTPANLCRWAKPSPEPLPQAPQPQGQPLPPGQVHSPPAPSSVSGAFPAGLSPSRAASLLHQCVL